MTNFLYEYTKESKNLSTTIDINDSLLHTYTVIKSYGISRPILDLIDPQNKLNINLEHLNNLTIFNNDYLIVCENLLEKIGRGIRFVIDKLWEFFSWLFKKVVSMIKNLLAGFFFLSTDKLDITSTKNITLRNDKYLDKVDGLRNVVSNLDVFYKEKSKNIDFILNKLILFISNYSTNTSASQTRYKNYTIQLKSYQNELNPAINNKKILSDKITNNLTKSLKVFLSNFANSILESFVVIEPLITKLNIDPSSIDEAELSNIIKEINNKDKIKSFQSILDACEYKDKKFTDINVMILQNNANIQAITSSDLEKSLNSKYVNVEEISLLDLASYHEKVINTINASDLNTFSKTIDNISRQLDKIKSNLKKEIDKYTKSSVTANNVNIINYLQQIAKYFMVLYTSILNCFFFAAKELSEINKIHVTYSSLITKICTSFNLL
jgi:hypothetical protein